MTAQPQLFDTPAQPRLKRKERESTYLAVLYLRSAGCKVYRAGRHEHLIDGKRVTSQALVARAGMPA